MNIQSVPPSLVFKFLASFWFRVIRSAVIDDFIAKNRDFDAHERVAHHVIR